MSPRSYELSSKRSCGLAMDRHRQGRRSVTWPPSVRFFCCAGSRNSSSESQRPRSAPASPLRLGPPNAKPGDRFRRGRGRLVQPRGRPPRVSMSGQDLRHLQPCRYSTCTRAVTRSARSANHYSHAAPKPAKRSRSSSPSPDMASCGYWSGTSTCPITQLPRSRFAKIEPAATIRDIPRSRCRLTTLTNFDPQCASRPRAALARVS